MISLSSATRIFIVTGATDMRKSFNGLYGIVAQQLDEDPLSGHVFVFCNRARNRIKLLVWDGSGLWVCAKRLEKGRFHWSWDTDEVSATITHESLSLLLGGLDLARVESRSWYRKNNLHDPDPTTREISIVR
jgi:transposase